MARREAYQWMEQSVPKEEKYIIEFVEAGDAHGIYNNLWNRFYKTTPLTISSEVGKFWSLTQENVAVDVFAATVHSVAEKLVAAGKNISDQDKATVFIGGLTKTYSQLKEQYRPKTTFKFQETVSDAIEFASLHGLLNSRSCESSVGTLFNVDIVCNEGSNLSDGSEIHSEDKFMNQEKGDVCYLVSTVEENRVELETLRKDHEELKAEFLTLKLEVLAKR
jgi:hypothetical protein